MEICELVVLVLGSSVLASFITALFTKSIANRKQYLQYITEERKHWRGKIRELTIGVSKATDIKQINALKTEFRIHLNPINDSDILDYMNRMEDKDHSINEEQRLNFEKSIAALLKHDWERVKYEASPQIKLWQIVLSGFFVYIAIENLFLKNGIRWCLLAWILGLYVFIATINLINRASYVPKRQYFRPDIYGQKLCYTDLKSKTRNLVKKMP